MTFRVEQIGVTGPSERIGGSSEFHIDTKFRSSMPISEIRKRFDAIAEKYRQVGATLSSATKLLLARSTTSMPAPKIVKPCFKLQVLPTGIVPVG